MVLDQEMIWQDHQFRHLAVSEKLCIMAVTSRVFSLVIVIKGEHVVAAGILVTSAKVSKVPFALLSCGTNKNCLQTSQARNMNNHLRRVRPWNADTWQERYRDGTLKLA